MSTPPQQASSTPTSHDPTAPATGSSAAVRKRGAIPELTSLRFFAALHVVIFHNLYLAGDVPLPRPVAFLVGHGYSAVSFFFVLSGFILAYSYCDAEGVLRTTRAGFWRARFSRIYPVYFLAFLIDVPRAVDYFRNAEPSLLPRLAKLAASAAAYLTCLQSWHPRVTTTWNSPAWSLSDEAFFYLLFPALVPLVFGIPRRRLVAATIATYLCTLAIVGFASVASSGTPSGAAWVLARSFPPARLPEFVLGIFAGRIHLQRAGSIQLGAATAASAAVILAVLTGLIPIPELLIQNGFLAPFNAVLILGLASTAFRSAAFLRWSPAVRLGEASYALYILHQPLKSWVVRAAASTGIRPGAFLFLSYVAVAIGGSLLARGFVEEPARRWIDARFRARVAAPAA